jgi:hypothetical protein
MIGMFKHLNNSIEIEDPESLVGVMPALAIEYLLQKCNGIEIPLPTQNTNKNSRPTRRQRLMTAKKKIMHDEKMLRHRANYLQHQISAENIEKQISRFVSEQNKISSAYDRLTVQLKNCARHRENIDKKIKAEKRNKNGT